MNFISHDDDERLTDAGRREPTPKDEPHPEPFKGWISPTRGAFSPSRLTFVMKEHRAKRTESPTFSFLSVEHLSVSASVRAPFTSSRDGKIARKICRDAASTSSRHPAAPFPIDANARRNRAVPSHNKQGQSRTVDDLHGSFARCQYKPNTTMVEQPDTEEPVATCYFSLEKKVTNAPISARVSTSIQDRQHRSWPFPAPPLHGFLCPRGGVLTENVHGRLVNRGRDSTSRDLQHDYGSSSPTTAYRMLAHEVQEALCHDSDALQG